ncbi:hypothetical protein PEBR_30443 [Penicillium brasilianum]|uniref:NACHT domain-containing protein n=1 Tax=Penicillium brasilianum TaxID=104259 RepID=A0A1S9RFY9_PENBI|nr:hypothetical protein PEBR_30443 [Penicillium brasilianum]
MSGAEALVAFGLACNVMQVIGFVQDGAHMCKTIYGTGSLDPQLAQTTRYIAESLERLRESLGHVLPFGKEEQELLEIAQGSLHTAAELKAELEKISCTMAKGKHSAAFRGWLRATLGGSKRVKRLEKVMRDRQHILETRLLLRICNKNDAILIQQLSDFDKLDTTLQALLKPVPATKQLSNSSLKSFKAVVSSESSQVQDNISAQIQNLTLNQTSKEERERLLGSFRYGTMNARRNQIPTTHDDTFSWIFDAVNAENGTDSQNSMVSLSHSTPGTSQVGFVEWLQASQQRPYWISGKTGSGKSVLMKFLVKHPHTKSILDVNGNTIVLSYFLWAAGHPLERNMQGALCSLIYQLLSKKPELSDKILERFPDKGQNRFPGDWSNEELLAVTICIFSAYAKHICIFLDGLDEPGTQDSQMGLTILLDKLCALPNVQVCASSRPEPVFQRYFSSCPQLRVQDLTQFDIAKYAIDTLKGLKIDDTERLSLLASNICRKADGVFLWVALALKSIKIGCCNDDDPAELESRLEALPNDLHALYQQMWRRLNDSEVIYRKTAAQYFNLVQECIERRDFLQTSNLTVLALALNPRLAATVVTEHIESFAEELDVGLERISKRLPVRCAGLLEVSKDGNVTFIHRSAQEFLVNTPEGQRIRQADNTSGENRLFNLARGLLGYIRLEIEIQRQPSRLQFHPVPSNFANPSDLAEAQEIQEGHCHRSTTQLVLSRKGKWTFDCNSLLHPDFLGAIAQAGFFEKALCRLAQLTSEAPHGMMRISRLYKLYVFEIASDPLLQRRSSSLAQDYAFFSTLSDSSSTKHAIHGPISPYQSRMTISDHSAFYLTSDPLARLLDEKLVNINCMTPKFIGFVVWLLETGYNMSDRTVILLDTTSPCFRCLLANGSCFEYEPSVTEGVLFLEVNTLFCISMYIRLLADRSPLFPSLFDPPTTFESLKTAVERLSTPVFARLLGFIPLGREYTGSDAWYHKYGYWKDEDRKNGAPESEPSRPEVFASREEFNSDNNFQKDENYDRDCSSESRKNPYRVAWASATKVLIPRTNKDSDFVLDGLSGNIFENITKRNLRITKRDLRFATGNLNISDIESRMRHISSNARRSTVRELEHTLVQAGFLVPRMDVPSFWPPSIYSPDDECAGTVNDSVLQDFLKW